MTKEDKVKNPSMRLTRLEGRESRHPRGKRGESKGPPHQIPPSESKHQKKIEDDPSNESKGAAKKKEKASRGSSLRRNEKFGRKPAGEAAKHNKRRGPTKKKACRVFHNLTGEPD